MADPKAADSARTAGAGRVAVVGAGLAGCLLATLLGRRGIEVTVYERREDPRTARPERGRSINLAISARGLDALDHVGLRELTLSRALPMHGRMVHSPEGQQSFRPYSADGTHAINSISRTELNLALLDVAERTPGVTIEFGRRLTDLDMATGAMTFETPGETHGETHGETSGEAHGETATAKADIVLAADGAYSAARRSVTFRQGFTFSQDYLEHGYRELTIPPKDGGFALDPDALHIWPRGSSMMIALPNLDRSFTCTLFWTGAEFAALESPEQIRAHFARHYPDVIGLIPNLVDDYLNNPLGSLATIRCWPWVHHGAGCTLALVGDAAHAIVPFYGQGANCAFEDCVEIGLCLSDAGGDWKEALAAYQERRKANCDAIADMALDNFIEMRDRVNSRVFQAKTAARHAMERRLPGLYVSRYELVSFTTMPYARIPDRIRRQDRATVLAAAAMAGAAGLLAAGAGAMMRRRGK